MIKIEQSTRQEFRAALPFIKQIIDAGETHAISKGMTDDEIVEYYFIGSSVFRVMIDEKIVGVYFLRKNRGGGGSHVGNAGFMVSPMARGKGVGRAMLNHCLETAKNMGFEALQFNFVVSTNIVAVNLWQSGGFKIIGTAPKAFNHPKLGKVDVLIMHKFL